MQSFEYVIKDKLGLHARPTGLLIKQTSQFKSDIKIFKGEKSANFKRLFDVMGLSVVCGDKVRVEISGEDESSALSHIKSFFESNF